VDCHGALRAPRNDKRLEIKGRWYECLELGLEEAAIAPRAG